MSLLSRGLPICTALAMILGGAAAFAETSLIGGVSQKDYKGATGAPAGGSASPLYFANNVYSGETVATPDAGATRLTFQDLTELHLGSNSTVVLDHFIYDPTSEQVERQTDHAHHLAHYPRNQFQADRERCGHHRGGERGACGNQTLRRDGRNASGQPRRSRSGDRVVQCQVDGVGRRADGSGHRRRRTTRWRPGS